jgi:glycosyltransferase involved in cell wall biosynthesis
MTIGMIYDDQFLADSRVKNEATSLLMQGHEVILFSLNYDNLPKQEVIDGITIIRYPSNKLEHKLSAVAYDFPFYHQFMRKKINDFIVRYNVQALHIHDMVIAKAAMQANQKFKLPVILDFHENRPEIMKAYKHVNSFPGHWLINLKRWGESYYNLAKEAEKVIVVTESAKHDILSHIPKAAKDIGVVPNTSKLEEFLSFGYIPEITLKMKGHFNLVYMGDTSMRRGTDTAIQAVALLKEKIPNIRLWLVGRSSFDQELKNMTFSLGLNDYVSFEGWQDMKLFPSYFSNSQVCISPLKRNLHHDTTFANKLFQYMSVGAPLVVSDCTAQAELVLKENCGLVHRADDPTDMANKIYELYQNPEASKLMGLNGKKSVEQVWNWNLTVYPLLEIYKELASR